MFFTFLFFLKTWTSPWFYDMDSIVVIRFSPSLKAIRTMAVILMFWKACGVEGAWGGEGLVASGGKCPLLAGGRCVESWVMPIELWKEHGQQEMSSFSREAVACRPKKELSNSFAS